jgi:hypothetical protein
VFFQDEILVQEILDPNKSVFFKSEKPLTPTTTKEKSKYIPLFNPIIAHVPKSVNTEPPF